MTTETYEVWISTNASIYFLQIFEVIPSAEGGTIEGVQRFFDLPRTTSTIAPHMQIMPRGMVTRLYRLGRIQMIDGAFDYEEDLKQLVAPFTKAYVYTKFVLGIHRLTRGNHRISFTEPLKAQNHEAWDREAVLKAEFENLVRTIIAHDITVEVLRYFGEQPDLEVIDVVGGLLNPHKPASRP